MLSIITEGESENERQLIQEQNLVLPALSLIKGILRHGMPYLRYRLAQIGQVGNNNSGGEEVGSSIGVMRGWV